MTSGSAPAVSVLMANFNGADWLAACLRSVLRQSVGDLEILFADDGSTDDSLGIASAIAAADPRLRILPPGSHEGPAARRNAGIAAARGTWLAVVDSDDMIHPRRFEILIAAAEAHGAGVVADDMIVLSDRAGGRGQRMLETSNLPLPTLISAEDFVRSEVPGAANAPMGYLKPLIRRDALGDVRYDETMQIGEDHDFYLRLLLGGARWLLVPEAMYLYRRGHQSSSRRLSPEAAAGMIAAQDRVAATLAADPARADLLDLMGQRRAALLRMAEFEALAQAIRAGRPGAALGALAARPHVLLPALARVTARRAFSGRADGGPAGTADVLPGLILAPDDVQVPPALAADVPPGSPRLPVPATPEDWDADAWAGFVAAAPRRIDHVLALGPGGEHALGYLPEWRSAAIVDPDGAVRTLGEPREGVAAEARKERGARPLVHIRTPTYRRPVELERCLRSLQAQTWSDWVCDVYDDCPDRSGAEVVRALDDPRIAYNANEPRRFASKNIDMCFSRANPRGADWFCVVEDDNWILPRFIEDNLAIARREGVEVVLRNQLVEIASGTPEAQLSETGILDRKFVEGRYRPHLFRLALMADIGMSNGGLFWSRQAKSDFEVHYPVSATLQEYARTYALAEDIYVAMEPLAVWAENGAGTTRDLGLRSGWLSRELRLKRSIIELQRRVWARAGRSERHEFLTSPAFAYPREARARGLVKSLAQPLAGRALPFGEAARQLSRGLMIRAMGRPEPGLRRFIQSRGV